MWKRRGPLTQLAAWMPGMEIRAVGSVRRSTAWNEGGGVDHVCGLNRRRDEWSGQRLDISKN